MIKLRHLVIVLAVVATSCGLSPATTEPTPRPIPASTPTKVQVAHASSDGQRVYLGNQVLLDVERDAPGCFSLGEISYSPTGQHFLVMLVCLEGDNDAFLFDQGGTNRIKVTAEQDYIYMGNFEWAPDGKSFVYQRTNKFGVAPPPDAPPEGMVRYIITTGEKILEERR